MSTAEEAAATADLHRHAAFLHSIVLSYLAPVRTAPNATTRPLAKMRADVEAALARLSTEFHRDFPSPPELPDCDLAALVGAGEAQHGAGARRVAGRIVSRALGRGSDWFRRYVERGPNKPGKPLQPISGAPPPIVPPLIEADPRGYVDRLLSVEGTAREVALRAFARQWNRWMRDPALVEWRRRALTVHVLSSLPSCADCRISESKPCLDHAPLVDASAILIFFCEWCAAPLGKIDGCACSPDHARRVEWARHGRTDGHR